MFWKDKLRDGWDSIRCSDYQPLANLAFYSLGALNRQAEDRTFIGSYTKRIDQGRYPRIEASDIETKMIQGANIINLDNFSVNDPRQYALLWSWDIGVDIPDEPSCTVISAKGVWVFQACDSEKNKKKQAVCYDAVTKVWKLTQQKLAFDEASEACHNDAAGYFSAPTNYSENLNLLQVLQAGKNKAAWLNIVYKPKNIIVVGDTRTHSEKP